MPRARDSRQAPTKTSEPGECFVLCRYPTAQLHHHPLTPNLAVNDRRRRDSNGPSRRGILNGKTMARQTNTHPTPSVKPSIGPMISCAETEAWVKVENFLFGASHRTYSATSSVHAGSSKRTWPRYTSNQRSGDRPYLPEGLRHEPQDTHFHCDPGFAEQRERPLEAQAEIFVRRRLRSRARRLRRNAALTVERLASGAACVVRNIVLVAGAVLAGFVAVVVNAVHAAA